MQNTDSNADVHRIKGRSSCVVVSCLTAVNSHSDSERFKLHIAFVRYSSLVFGCNKYGHCMNCSLRKFRGLQQEGLSCILLLALHVLDIIYNVQPGV
jgi:hypothetical protein